MRSSVSQIVRLRASLPSKIKRQVLYKAFAKNLFFSKRVRFSSSYNFSVSKTNRYVHSTKFRNYCFVIRKYGSFYSATKITRHMSRRYLITGFFPGYRIASWLLKNKNYAF
jgi:hypothetical protein